MGKRTSTKRSPTSVRTRKTSIPTGERNPLAEWRQLPGKDNISHYESDLFRRQYTLEEMRKRAKDVKQWVKSPIKRLLNIRLQEASTSAAAVDGQPAVRLLSLGCGPGSDLLGALGCLADEARLLSGGRPRIECTGVDLMSWDRTDFYRRVRELGFDEAECNANFVQEDMRTFMICCALLGLKFDLITLSYANAKTVVPLLACLLPLLMQPGGSIVIIDNRSSQLRELCNKNSNYKVAYNKNKKQLVIVYKL